MKDIILLGDSIFDNKSYVGDAPDVITHLRQMIAPDWSANLLAVDGSLVENVGDQLEKVSSAASHLVVSVGGNNAIMNSDILQMKANSAAEVFDELANRINDFETKYKQMLTGILSKNLSTVVCTIYYPNFPEPLFQKIATAALSSFNDVIIRQAVSNGLALLDLRLVCNEADDYANEIEPSSKGGKKIAAKILEVVETRDFSKNKTEIFF